ncbi:hypothetical protein FSP39_007741 [Pinctada imbricata]|uniref:CCHC-type domain-containing protein n=1 Tax=Pinctada imbricata TaxID=66713 RepID=A0AA89CA56_PINIB|nr:hypothetical protein FSP39_007741 [Pinctada imbricata]
MELRSRELPKPVFTWNRQTLNQEMTASPEISREPDVQLETPQRENSTHLPEQSPRGTQSAESNTTFVNQSNSDGNAMLQCMTMMQSCIQGMQDMIKGLTTQNNINNSGVNDTLVRRSVSSDVRVSGNNHPDEPKPRLPIFSGKGTTSWESFWIQFQMLSDRFSWQSRKQAEQLFFCLKDDALTFASELSQDVRTDIFAFHTAMKQRFADHTLPETYRAKLQSMHRKLEEPIQEFGTRISLLMTKAYPGLNDEKLKSELAIGHFLNGLNDQSIAYDVATKRPETLQSAIDMVTWHECCKNGMKKKTSIRNVDCDFDQNREEDRIVQRVGQDNNFDFRLNKLENMVKEIKAAVIDRQASGGKQQRPTFNGTPRKLTCFGCNEEGHIRRDCPRQNDKSQKKQDKGEVKQGPKPLNSTGLAQ